MNKMPSFIFKIHIISLILEVIDNMSVHCILSQVPLPFYSPAKFVEMLVYVRCLTNWKLLRYLDHAVPWKSRSQYLPMMFNSFLIGGVLAICDNSFPKILTLNHLMKFLPKYILLKLSVFLFNFPDLYVIVNWTNSEAHLNSVASDFAVCR